MTLKSEHVPEEQWKILSVWCEDCGHQAEPDPAELARRYGADTPIPEWHRRLVCSGCGGREVDFVLTGARG